MTRILTATFSVSAQLSPADLPAIATQGFKTVINNRPDGEGGDGQPRSADMQRAAQAAGLHYVYLPVVSGALTPANVQAMRDALASAPAPVLAYCRSGARSAQLHGLAFGQTA